MKPTTQVSGGQRIGQKIKAMQDRLRSNSGVYVGIPSGAGQYEDGTPLAVIGAVHEFGSANGHIPERSFLRVPLRSNQAIFGKIMGNGLRDVVDGTSSMRSLMDQIGARAAAVSQEAIAAGISPPNSPSTVKSKGSSTPLVDTGRLRQSITWAVEGASE